MIQFRHLHSRILFVVTFLALLPFLYQRGFAQVAPHKWKPGFDVQECEDMFKLNFAFLDTVRGNPFVGYLDGYRIHYRSQVVGMDNASDIWIRRDSAVVLLLRGTTQNMLSILQDFYCAMMPAKGEIRLSNDKVFEYELATDPRAAVHAGFLIGFAYLADEIQPRIDALYRADYRRFLVAGHSQGGALSYYVSAWLMHLAKKGVYPEIGVKTYASAPPKMGNMYFAYDYDNMQRSQWSFSIVNTADPIPEMPFTTQQVEIDMNEPNPILNLMERFDDLPFLKRIVLKRAFGRMKKRAEKSSTAYQKYLGNFVGGTIHKSLPEMQLPEPVPTTYFVRPGVPITLSTNERYWQYVAEKPKYFHHGVDPYRFLLREYYEGLSEFTPLAD